MIWCQCGVAPLHDHADTAYVGRVYHNALRCTPDTAPTRPATVVHDPPPPSPLADVLRALRAIQERLTNVTERLEGLEQRARGYPLPAAPAGQPDYWEPR